MKTEPFSELRRDAEHLWDADMQRALKFNDFLAGLGEPRTNAIKFPQSQREREGGNTLPNDE